MILLSEIVVRFEFSFATQNANQKWTNQLTYKNFGETVTFATTKLTF